MRTPAFGGEAGLRPYQSTRLNRYHAVLSLGAEMRRRDLLGVLGGAAAAWPIVAAHAQQSQNPLRIGFLPIGSPSNSYDQLLVEAFRKGLREVGVIENRHVVLDFVWIRNEPELPEAVNELMQRGVKLLIPCGTSASVAAKRQVSTIPILFINVGNPVGAGWSRASRARVAMSPVSATCMRI